MPPGEYIISLPCNCTVSDNSCNICSDVATFTRVWWRALRTEPTKFSTRRRDPRSDGTQSRGTYRGVSVSPHPFLDFLGGETVAEILARNNLGPGSEAERAFIRREYPEGLPKFIQLMRHSLKIIAEACRDHGHPLTEQFYSYIALRRGEAPSLALAIEYRIVTYKTEPLFWQLGLTYKMVDLDDYNGDPGGSGGQPGGFGGQPWGSGGQPRRLGGRPRRLIGM